MKMVRFSHAASVILCIWLQTSQSNAEPQREESPLIVQTSYGPVEGFQYVSQWSNKTIYAFRGIPYAAPPVGKLRFKDPLPPEKWTTVRNCSLDGPSCMQASNTVLGFRNITFDMSEDCLYLNVHSPKLPKEGDLLPVMVWVHGGAFLEGSGSYFRYGPDHLVGEGVIVVTLNYRLGALGFLSLGTAECPGNAGLKDQNAALQWVRSEISQFGGNPQNVTLFGESAGSASVHLHYLSPLSKGLFQRVIGESGTALADWTIAKNLPTYSRRLAESLNCSSGSAAEVVDCLRAAKAEDITAQQFRIRPDPQGEDGGANLVFVPCVDAASSRPFLPDTPARLVDLGEGSHVPFVMGINSDEGMMMLMMSTIDSIKNITNNLDKVIPYNIRKQSSTSRMKILIERLKNFYFKEPPSETNLRGYVDLFTDQMFGYSTAVSARVFRERAPVYLYLFAFNGKFKEIFTYIVENKFNFSGVSHAEELSYIFEREKVIQEAPEDSNEMKTWRRMVRLWTNFAKFGKPTVGNDSVLEDLDWKPVGNVATKYLMIDVNLTMEESDFLASRVALWDTITPSAASNLHTTSLLAALGVSAYVWRTARISD